MIYHRVGGIFPDHPGTTMSYFGFVETCPSPPLDLRSRPPRIDTGSWMLASRTWIETTDDKIPPPDVVCPPWIVIGTGRATRGGPWVRVGPGTGTGRSREFLWTRRYPSGTRNQQSSTALQSMNTLQTCVDFFPIIKFLKLA
jgi:hypothetical protein